MLFIINALYFIITFCIGKCEEFTSKNKFAKLLSEAVSYIESHPNIIEILENNIIIK